MNKKKAGYNKKVVVNESIIRSILMVFINATSVLPSFRLEKKKADDKVSIIFLLILLSMTMLPLGQAAEVNVDTSTVTGTTQRNPGTLVFTTESTGYRIYVDTTGTQLKYSKTTDGGTSWGGAVNFSSMTTVVAYACWYDKWTPGDTGTKIQCTYSNSANGDLYYRSLDTASDTLDTETAFYTTPTASSSSTTFLAMSKNTTGALFVAFQSTGTSAVPQVFSCSGSCTTAGNWVQSLTTDSGQLDKNRLIPQASGGMVLVENDISADTIRYKTYSSGTWDGSWTTLSGSCRDNTTANYRDGTTGAVIDSKYNIYVLCEDNPSSSPTFRVWNFTPGSTPTVGTFTAGSLATGADIMIDKITEVLYVAYLSGTTLSNQQPYYRRSYDGGNTWDSQITLSTTTGTASHIVANTIDENISYATFGRTTNQIGTLLVDLTNMTYIPPEPTLSATNPDATSVITTITPGGGNVTDLFDAYNGSAWSLGNTVETSNLSTGQWANVTVFAVNTTNGSRSSSRVSLNYQLILLGITANSNNYTNNDSLSLTVPSYTIVNFSVTTNTPSNTSITCDFTNKSTGVTFIENSSCSNGVIYGTYAFNTSSSQYVNIGVTQFGTTAWTNWTVSVSDHYFPSPPTNFTNQTTPAANSITLIWDNSTDLDDAIDHYVVEKKNESFNWLTVPRQTLNASGITSGYKPDAYWYEYRTPASVMCGVGCHGSGGGDAGKDIYSGNFWIKYNSTHLFLFAHSPDNDTNETDDQIRIIFDVNKDGGTSPETDDISYNLFENGTLEQKIGNGTVWVIQEPGNTSAVGMVNGGGSYSPRYELWIPLSEIGSPTNGTTIKWMFEQECTAGADFVERHSYFPSSADEDVPDTWQITTFRSDPDYIWIANTSNSQYTVTDLTGNYKYNFSVKGVDTNGNIGDRTTFLISTLNSMSYTVSGYVLNAYGTGLANVEVFIQDYREHTEANGLYHMELINGTYTIQGRKNGYFTDTSLQAVEGADIPNVNLTMATDSSFRVSLPVGYLNPEFSPTTANESNVDPGGQSAGTAFFQFTNDGNVPQIFRMYLDAVVPSIDIYTDLDSNHDSGRVFIDTTTSTIIVSGLTLEGGVQNVWLLADFNSPPPGTYNGTLTVNSSQS